MTTTQLIIALTSLPASYWIGFLFVNITFKKLRKALEHKNIIISNDGEYIRELEKENEVLKRRFEDLSFGFKKLEDSFKSARIRRRNNFWRKNRNSVVK